MNERMNGERQSGLNALSLHVSLSPSLTGCALNAAYPVPTRSHSVPDRDVSPRSTMSQSDRLEVRAVEGVEPGKGKGR